MEVLKFTLSGVGATFTKPYFNSYFATYNHIHKIAILGILGSVIGIRKNILDTDTLDLPKFYKELNSLKISIVPSMPLFEKDRVMFTETTGMFNAGDKRFQGNTYLADIEELINPSWDIYIDSNNNKHYETIKNMLIKGYSVYDIYLGKNHHFANISNVEILTGQSTSNIDHIDSIFPLNIATDVYDSDDEDDKEYKVMEFMPISFGQFNQYSEKMMLYTNKELDIDVDMELIFVNDKILYFI